MNFKEYTPLAKRTITYDSHEKLLFCSMAGLMGEYTEYTEHLDCMSPQKLITAEIGDICWDLAILIDYLGIDVIPRTCPSYELDVHGFVTIGKIQEVLKKVARDNDWIPDELQKGTLEMLFNDLLYGITNKCLEFGMNLSDLLQANLEKLADRAKRGVLKGSGDER